MLKVPMKTPGADPQFDLKDALKKACDCGAELFQKAIRLGVISALAPSNRTQQDIIVEYPVYVCRTCGQEFGSFATRQ